MKIKAAYYLRTLPDKIAVVLPDDRAMITDLAPFRAVTEDELAPLAALDQPAYRRAMLGDKVPDYALRFYGLEIVG